jgi:hypothetical protein
MSASIHHQIYSRHTSVFHIVFFALDKDQIIVVVDEFLALAEKVRGGN